MLEVGSLQAAWELNFLNLDFFTEGFCFGPGLSALLLTVNERHSKGTQSELTNTYRTLRVRVAVLSRDSVIDRVSSVTYTLISTPHFVPLPLDRKKQDTLHSVLAGLLTMPIPTPPPENPGVPVNLSWMNHTIPTNYFDVNKRIEELRSYMNWEMYKNQIEAIKTTIRLYEDGTLDGRWGRRVIIQDGGIVPLGSLQLDKPYWIEVSLSSWAVLSL